MEFRTLTKLELYDIVVKHCRALPRYKTVKGQKQVETIEQALVRTSLQFDIADIWNEFVLQWDGSEGSRNRYATAVRKTLVARSNVHSLLKRDILHAIFNWQEKNQPAQVVSQES